MYLFSLKFKENVRISQAMNWTIVRLQSLWLVYQKRPRKSTVQVLRRTELTALQSHIHTPKALPQQVLEHTHTCTSRAQPLAMQPTGCPSAPGWAAPPAALHPGAVPAGHRQQPHCHVFCSRVLSVGGCAPGPPASCALRPPTQITLLLPCPPSLEHRENRGPLPGDQVPPPPWGSEWEMTPRVQSLGSVGGGTGGEG